MRSEQIPDFPDDGPPANFHSSFDGFDSCPHSHTFVGREYSRLSIELCRFQRTEDEYVFKIALNQAEPRLRAYFQRRFRHHAVCVDDALQETAIRLFLKIQQYQCRPNAWPWVEAIAHNIAIDEIRKFQTRAKHVRQLYIRAGGDDGCFLQREAEASADDQPENAAQLNEFRARVATVLGDLTPSEQEIVRMRHDSVSFKQISQILQMPTTTVWQIVKQIHIKIIGRNPPP